MHYTQHIHYTQTKQMTRGDVPSSILATYTSDLLAAAKTKPFRDLFFAPAGVNEADHIFAGDAVDLVAVQPSARTHIGTAYEAFRSLAALQAAPLAAAAGGAAAPGAQTTAKWWYVVALL
jgi:hypothetical protein